METPVPVKAQCEVHLFFKSSLRHQTMWQVLLWNHKALGEQKCQLRRQCAFHYRRWLNYAKGGKRLYSFSCTGLDRPWGLQKAEAPRFQDNRHMKVVRLSALYPQHMLLVLISVRGWVDSWAIVQPEGLCQWKIPMAPSIGNRTRDLPAAKVSTLKKLFI